MNPTENGDACDACAVSEADALRHVLISRDIERARANELERQLAELKGYNASLTSDLDRAFREREALKDDLREARAALRAMAYLTTEVQLKAQSQALAR